MIAFTARRLERKPARFAFLAKKQVAIGQVGSHSPRDWMWHGQDPARHSPALLAPSSHRQAPLSASV